MPKRCVSTVKLGLRVDMSIIQERQEVNLVYLQTGIDVNPAVLKRSFRVGALFVNLINYNRVDVIRAILGNSSTSMAVEQSEVIHIFTTHKYTLEGDSILHRGPSSDNLC